MATSSRIDSAIAFIADCEIEDAAPEGTFRDAGSQDSIDRAVGALSTQTAGSAIVGCEVLAFAPGLPPKRRVALVNSALLAQLVANSRVPDHTRLLDWYQVYFDSLVHLGWAVEDKAFVEHHHASSDFLAHKAILSIAEALLVGAPASLALVRTTIDALRSMDADSPWITLFARESQGANSAKFQIGVAEGDQGNHCSVNLMSFCLTTQATLLQVLFFKSKSSEVTFSQLSGSVTVSTDVLDSTAALVKRKLSRLARQYVLELPELA